MSSLNVNSNARPSFHHKSVKGQTREYRKRCRALGIPFPLSGAFHVVQFDPDASPVPTPVLPCNVGGDGIMLRTGCYPVRAPQTSKGKRTPSKRAPKRPAEKTSPALSWERDAEGNYMNADGTLCIVRVNSKSFALYRTGTSDAVIHKGTLIACKEHAATLFESRKRVS